MNAFLYRIVAVIAQQAPPHGIRQDEFLFAGLRKLYGHNGSLTADDGSRAEGRMDHLPATYRLLYNINSFSVNIFPMQTPVFFA